jgi:CheY-like chemotaxis protein
MAGLQEETIKTPGLDHSILVVDDDFLVAQGMVLQVEDMGRRVCAIAHSCDEAVAMALVHRPQLALIDVRLSGMKDGVDAAIAIHALVGSKVIFITGSREQATLNRIAEDHPAAILFKPVTGLELRDAVDRVLGA